MALSRKLARVTLKVITKLGRDATLNSTEEGAYNPNSDTPNHTVVQSTIKIFEGAYNKYEARDMEIGDVPLYTTSELDNNDTVEYGGNKYSIIRVQKTNVNEDTVLYVAQARAI